MKNPSPATMSKFIECNDLYNEIKTKAMEHMQMGALGRAVACFDTRNLEALRQIKHNLDLGIELHELQSHCNSGRGVSCVKQVADTLMRGDVEGAKAITHTDWDKIANYPALAKWLKEKEFADAKWYVID